MTYNKSARNWRAVIYVDGKHQHIGYFDTAEEATRAYNSTRHELQLVEEQITIPFRLCCLNYHVSLICPDGKVMCESCFNRFSIDALYVDNGGVHYNICLKCASYKESRRLTIARSDDEVQTA